MQVHAEFDDDDIYGAKLKRFRLDGRHIEVIENLDRWCGRDYTYFKVGGDDGNLYILRQDETRDAWELIMFQRRPAEGLADTPGTLRPRRDGGE